MAQSLKKKKKALTFDEILPWALTDEHKSVFTSTFCNPLPKQP